MFSTIKFSRMLTFLGRNGTFKSSGMEISQDGNDIDLYPLTSRGDTGRSRISIPLEDVPALIAELQKFAPPLGHCADLEDNPAYGM